MQAVKSGDVSVYTISGAEARPLPDWLVRRRKRSLKNDPNFQHRVELLQDFEFEESSRCIRVSEDGDWIMSTGEYKPQIHVHYTAHLSLSFARHTKSLNTTFQLLSTDYSKSIHLQSNRAIELHTKGGLHFETRVPRYGRDLAYDKLSTEALIGSVGLNEDGNGEVYRLNLELGRFMKSYEVDVGTDDAVEKGLQGSIGVGSINKVAIAENSHGLCAFGTSIGTIEFFDPRSKHRVAIISDRLNGEVTALDFSPSGLSLATGGSTGLVKIFDLRSPVPLLQKDHGMSEPIKEIMHLTTASQERKMLVADKNMIKIWDELDGKSWAAIEPSVDINSVAWVKHTGMLLSANEGKQQHAWFIPQLGAAPRWCTFLDNMVEEMAEEIHTDTYDNYKFLELHELKSLGLAHLVGKSNLLRPYMHGFFVAYKLYDQARLIANPYAWEEERAKRVKEKVEKERASRIRGQKKVKVNQRLADKLLKRQENRAEIDPKAGILGDPRFSKIFEDEEFRIDENSREFQLLNPSTKVDQDNDSDVNMDASSSGEDENSNTSDERDDEVVAPKPEASNRMEMKVSSSSKGTGRQARDTALGSRTPKSGRVTKKHGGEVVGERAMTFVPESRKKKIEKEVEPVARDKHSGNRRSASGNVFRRM